MSAVTRKSKRRHSQAFPEERDVEEEAVSAPEEEPAYVQSTGQDRLDKEREVWDAFKDEHVEVFDLSSSLLRRFHLVRELDQQVSQNREAMLGFIMKYAEIRRAAAAKVEEVESERPASPQPARDASSRELLATIAKLLEASIRDAEEKVNLCKTAGESVDRSIRLIDQATQEQEHAITLGARSGTHLAPILLPDITLPAHKKPTRVALSPDLDDNIDADYKVSKQVRRKKSRKGRKKDTGDTIPFVRPTPPIIPNPDPNEPRYCYCDQVSHGEMIACDDKKCKREWFHLVCTGLEMAPDGPKKWYCDDCIERRRKKK